MEKVNIEGIEIIYNENQKQELEKIIQIIKLNKQFFSDWQNNTLDFRNKTFKDFDATFDLRLKGILNNSEIQNALTAPDLLPAIYTQYLIKSLPSDSGINVLFEDNMSDDVLYFLLACKYYNCETQFDELASSLKYHEDEEVLIGWLKEYQRIETYNYLLKTLSETLKEYDLSFYHHIGELGIIFTGEVLNFAISSQQSHNLENMSLDEVDATFIQFLDQIKAPIEWKQEYLKLKENKDIIYEDCVNDNDTSESFIGADGKRKIKVINHNTVESFISLVHEFIHHITFMSTQKSIPFSLLEFPSIYFEKIASIYLINRGYKEENVNVIANKRNQNNLDIYSSIFEIMLDIIKYNKNGQVSIEEKIESVKTTDESFQKTKNKIRELLKLAGVKDEKLEYLKPQVINYEEIVKKQCDDNILRFAKDGMLILRGYQYLIANFLAKRLLEKSEIDIVSKMIYITENLADFTIDTLVESLGIEDVFDKGTAYSIHQ